MVSAITKNISVSVETTYLENASKPALDNYLFSYQISIKNEGDYTVKLIRRYWYIFDSIMERRIVEGEGVVGEQPVLAPGETYTYQSYCQLKSDAGCMKGFYIFNREMDSEQFDVMIPEFTLIPEFRRN